MKIKRNTIKEIFLDGKTRKKISIELGQDAKLKLHLFQTSAKVSVFLKGKRAEAEINNVSFIRDSNSELNVEIKHLAFETRSSLVSRAVVGPAGVFKGNAKTVIVKKAREAEAHQEMHSLLLADNAEISAVPAMEIDNDQVKATHGVTAGHLDDSQLFYLRSRGIGMQEGRTLLTLGFLKKSFVNLPEERKQDFEKAVATFFAEGLL